MKIETHGCCPADMWPGIKKWWEAEYDKEFPAITVTPIFKPNKQAGDTYSRLPTHVRVLDLTTRNTPIIPLWKKLIYKFFKERK